jgi:hypothetical protein
MAVTDAGHPGLAAFDTTTGKVCALDPQQGPAVEPHLVHHLATDRGTTRQYVPSHEEQDRQKRTGPATLDADRDLAAVRTAEDGRVLRGDLEGDVAAGVGCADDEHGSGLQLVRTTVGTRVQLQDLG